MDGIDYFPHFTVNSDELRIIQSKFGIAGYGIIYKLFERIFHNGYFCFWSDKICNMFAKLDCGAESELCSDVVKEALKIGIFDFTKYNDYGILTSVEIQQLFFNITKKRAKVFKNDKYMLIDIGALPDPAPVNNTYTLFDDFDLAVSTGRTEDFILSCPKLAPWIDCLGVEVIIAGIIYCKNYKNKRSETYLSGIFKRWKEYKYFYLSDLTDVYFSTPAFLTEFKYATKKAE